MGISFMVGGHQGKLLGGVAALIGWIEGGLQMQLVPGEVLSW